MTRRAFVVVLDACGAGACSDAADYGDADASTLQHVAEAAGGLRLPVLGTLGLGSILPLAGVAPARDPVVHGRLHPLGPGKDTTAGHWELMGVVAPGAPTYPDGFDVARLQDALGAEVLCNAPANGIEAIERHGEEHLRTGRLIVYTSVDSVLQIAAHEEVLDARALYAVCERARTAFPDVGRIIARPFRGAPGAFERTDGRRDFALAPPSASYLEAISPVHGVGKVSDVFAGRGIDASHPGATNAAAIASTTALMRDLDAGLVFANLVETDQVYGHRNDVEGFARALEVIDGAVGEWLELLDPERDLLVLTADHGCDPTTPGTDHTREHAPLLARFAGHGGRRHDGTLADVGASVAAWLGAVAPGRPGASFL